MKQTDFVNDDRSVYTYYLQQDGIKLSPEGYSIGSEGDETEYYGQFAKISMEDNGYMIMIQKASEVVERESVSSDSEYQMKMQYRLCMMLCGMGYRFQHWKQIRLQIRYRLRFNIFQ
ncbi:MAG: hypothetical protein V8S84_09240 [Lachnospiraceae bacterium]